MKLKIKDEPTMEDTLEIWLEMSRDKGSVLLVSQRNNDHTKHEFKIRADGSWVKYFSGNLQDE